MCNALILLYLVFYNTVPITLGVKCTVKYSPSLPQVECPKSSTKAYVGCLSWNQETIYGCGYVQVEVVSQVFQVTAPLKAQVTAPLNAYQVLDAQVVLNAQSPTT